MLSNRVKEIEASRTVLIAGEAKRLKSEGIDFIDLSVGESDFNTPENIKEAGKSAIDNNLTRYTINQGTIELRNAIAAKLKRDNNLVYSPNEIIVSNGAKQSIYNSIMAVVNPGDEVIVAAPYWVSYPSMIQLAGGKMVVIDTDESTGFKITPSQLEKVITSKSKLLIMCNPSNPTGTVYNKDELKALSEVALKNNLLVLSDEIYEKLIYDKEFTSFASLSEEIKNRSIIVNGISKSYAMTGWRLGYVAADEEIVAAINKIQSHSTSSASSISQFAAIEAVAGPQTTINEMIKQFKDRRDFMFSAVTSIDGISCYKPDGAFYLFPNINDFLDKTTKVKIHNSFDLSMYLLREAHIAVVPGSAFGKEGFIRISFSTSMNNLTEAVKRLKTAFAKIS